MSRFLIFILGIQTLISCYDGPEKSSLDDHDRKEWMLPQFVKVDSINPILHPEINFQFQCPLSGSVNWQERNVLNPAALVKDDKVYLFYRAQDKKGTSRIGMAVSEDGLHFEKLPDPVFYPDNDDMQNYEWHYEKSSQVQDDRDYFDGVEDPRIVEGEDGTYIMTYTAYDGRTARLCIASSRDLVKWQKHGLVLGNEMYKDLWSKSGAIISRREESRIIATMINGKYWMYFGDTNLFMATSEDLIHWEVAENSENGEMISVLHPRKGYFDSRLVEPGPYALITEAGIHLIYNASNASNYNDPNLSRFTYAAGQALFDSSQPYKLIQRSDSYFIAPDKDYEKIGEVNEVCFVEGMVYFNNRWMIYYGTADSKIAVAVESSGE